MIEANRATGDVLLRAGEVAKVLGVSPRTLWTWTRAGRLPAVCVGKVKRYRRSDVDAFIASQPAASQADFEARRRQRAA